MNVFVVTTGDYSSYQVKAICSTKEQAEKLVEMYSDANDVEEYELDTFKSLIDQGLEFYHIKMDRDGNVLESDKIDPSNHGEPNPDSFEYNRGRCYNTHFQFLHLYDEPHFKCEVWAKNKEHAIKITNEKRTEYIALGKLAVDEAEYQKKLQEKLDREAKEQKERKEIEKLAQLNWLATQPEPIKKGMDKI